MKYRTPFSQFSIPQSFFLLIVVTIFLTYFSGCGAADNSTQVAAVNITGHWVGTFASSIPSNGSLLETNFSQSGSGFTGDVTMADASCPLNGAPVTGGTISGSNLSWSAGSTQFSGTVNISTIRGTYKCPSDSGSFDLAPG